MLAPELLLAQFCVSAAVRRFRAASSASQLASVLQHASIGSRSYGHPTTRACRGLLPSSSAIIASGSHLHEGCKDCRRESRHGRTGVYLSGNRVYGVWADAVDPRIDFLTGGTRNAAGRTADGSRLSYAGTP